MSVDHSIGNEMLVPPVDPPADPDGAATSFFHSAPRVESEPGGWSLLLVPVIVCVALLVFIAIIPH